MTDKNRFVDVSEIHVVATNGSKKLVLYFDSDKGRDQFMDALDINRVSQPETDTATD